MTSPYRIERDRGAKESPQQIAVLREKWPLAFPVKHQDVRPLAMGAAGEIAAVMGWSLPYTLGVLGRWKMAPVYCQAVLCYDQRIALDGAPAEPVGAEAKDLATKQLAKLAARKAAKKAAKPPAPAGVTNGQSRQRTKTRGVGHPMDQQALKPGPLPEIRNDEGRRVTTALLRPSIPLTASRVRAECIRDPSNVLLRAVGFP
jgi:sRNA-binding protein